MTLFEFVHKHRYKIFKTILTYLTFACLGGIYTLMGSTLLDLQVLLQRSFETTSHLIPVRAISHIIGASTCGLYEKHIDDYLILSTFNLIAGVSVGLIPWFTNLQLVFTLMIITGFANGVFDVYCNIIILRIWGKNVGNWLQGLYMCFGIGALITPVFTRPFLLPSTETDDNNLSLSINNFNNFTAQSVIYSSSDVKIKYPFMITGGILIAVAIPTFFCYLYDKKMKNISENEPESEQLPTNASKIKKAGAIVMTGILTNFAFGTEAVIGSLCTVFAVKADIKMDKKTAVLIATVYWLMYSFYRLIFLQLSVCIKKNYLFNMNLLIILAGAFVLVTKAAYNSTYTWIAFTLLGIGYSPVFSLSFALLGEYFHVTNTMTSYIFVNGVLGETIHTAILSRFIETKPVIFTYYLGVMATIYVIISFSLPYYCEKVIGKLKSDDGKVDRVNYESIQ